MATEITMNDLLQATIDEGASDLHVRAFMPPKLRIHGELVEIADEAFSEDDTFKLCHEIMTAEQSAEVEKNGGADFALSHEDGTRFRVSVFKERKRWGCVLRMIPSTLLTLEQIGLPDTVKELLFKPRGLILVTGPTGSGKSTTLASMINVINEERAVHTQLRRHVRAHVKVGGAVFDRRAQQVFHRYLCRHVLVFLSPSLLNA